MKSSGPHYDNPNDLKFFELSNWKNFYTSNDLLEEEARYIFDWKYQDWLTGNTLDKPTLLLKRAFVKDTQFERKAQGRGGAEIIWNIGSPSKQVK